MSDKDFQQRMLYLPHVAVYNSEFVCRTPEGVEHASRVFLVAPSG